MATVSNQLSAVVPKLLAQGLMALRENAIMPRLVNSGYSEMAGEKGSTIEIPVPSSIVAKSVNANSVADDSDPFEVTSIALPLTEWKEASFTLTDKELLEVQSGTIPMAASQAIRALANDVDNYILSLWSKIPYVIVGETAGTPFDPSTYSASDARTKGMSDIAKVMTSLNKSLASPEDRRFVVDPIAYGNLVQMRGFQDMSWSGSLSEIIEGKLSRKLGFDWFLSQNLPKSHTWGAAFTGTTDKAAAVAANTSAGANTVTVTAAGHATTPESLALKAGDVVRFSNHADLYVVTADVTIAGTTAPAAVNGNVAIYPSLRKAITTAHTLLVVGNKATSTPFSEVPPVPSGDSVGAKSVCLAFHRDAFAFASRPLASVDMGLGVPSSSAVDPVSGLSLRLEVNREYKRTRFSYDILYGAQLVRPELGCRYEW